VKGLGPRVVPFCARATRGAARTARRVKNCMVNERLARQLKTVRR
jgi:hypothetical protein